MPGIAKPTSMYYVGPGGLTFLASSVLILMAALYTQANLLFWSFGLLVGGLLCSIGVSWLMLRGLTVERVLPPHAVAGEPMAIRYQITNTKWWMPVFSLVVAEAWPRRRVGWGGAEEAPHLRGRPHGWALHVGPGQSVLAEAPCWPTRRGRLVFERIEVWSSFPFGMLGRKLMLDRPDKLTVYPHLFRVRRRSFQALLHGDPTTPRRVQTVGISDEFYGLREYRTGDRLRAIDWKRTARTGKLVAKDTARPGITRVMVLLDLTALGAGAATPPAAPRPRASLATFLGRAKPPGAEPPLDPAHPWVDAERAISLAASFLGDAYFQGFPIGLAVRGARCPVFRVHRSLPHRTMILDALAALDLSQPAGPEQEKLIHPTVVIRPRAAGNAGGPAAGPTALNAGDLEQYVTEIEGGATAWLTSGVDKPRHAGRGAAWK